MRLARGSPTRPSEKGEAVNQLLKIYEICLYFPLTPKIIGLNHQPYIVISEFTRIGGQMYWGENSCGSTSGSGCFQSHCHWYKISLLLKTCMKELDVEKNFLNSVVVL